MRYNNPQFPRTAGVRRAAARSVIYRGVRSFMYRNNEIRNREAWRNRRNQAEMARIAMMPLPRLPVARMRRYPINVRR